LTQFDTNSLLDILAAQCVKATFFLVTEIAHAHRSTVRRIFEKGHTIGTYSEDLPLALWQAARGRERGATALTC
jgi:peptidoglycan/xylan/chitin deacetylase (PgdA/CDA1 family)